VRATLIVNPYASRVSEPLVRAVEHELSSQFELETVLTERRGHATELSRAAAGEAVFVLGGDGVFNEVLNGLDGTRPVGLLPGGGANVLPRALGLPEDALEAARRLLGAGRRRISLGRVNGRRFGFSAGIGIDADSVRRVDAKGRRPDGRRPGDLAFVAAALGALLDRRGRYEPQLEIVGYGRAGLVLVSNDAVFTYAGAMPVRFCPEASFDLGLDFAAPERLGPLSLARLIGRVASGRGAAGAKGVFAGHDLDRIEVRCDVPLALQADGEDLGDVESAVFEAERGAVEVLV
jgi:diacylglycerol kinase family enzyme